MFNSITLEEFKALPDNIMTWLMVEIQEEIEIENKSLEEIYTEFTTDYFDIFYFDKDINEDEFSFDREGGIILINGNINSEVIHFYGITDIFINGDVKCDSVITGDASFTVEGNFICKDAFINTDTSSYFTIKKDLNTKKTINLVPDDGYAENINIGNVPSIPELYIAKNSYDEMGSGDLFKKYNISKTGELSEEEMMKYF